MKVDLQAFETWENLNATVAQDLTLADEVTVRCYQGLASAVFELAQGTAQFYSHKRSIAVVPGATPYFQNVLPYFYREAYQVQIAPEKFVASEWIETLKKDTSFVLLCEDHAVTGELYEHKHLEKLLNDRKIFCLKISHHNHFYRKEEVQPYSARICAYDPQTTVAVIGSKIKSPALVSSSMHWEAPAFLDALAKAKNAQIENQSLVVNFEQNLPHGFSALLQTSNRCFDRALIYTTEAGGESIQQYLASALKIQLEKPGFERRIETTHLCRWGGTTTSENWWIPRPAESILRGLLILGTDILEHPEVKSSLEKALRECQIVDLS